VKFINTDGMAFIGPGSEWFWTALSGIVLAVTFLAIYRQLRLQRSASAREQLASMDREWMSERMTSYQLAVVTALRDGADRAQLPDGPASGLANWWERIGQLARSGDIDRKTLYPGYGLHAQAWWAILAPYVRQKRAEQGNPHNFEDNEWLAGIMAEMDRQAGRPPADEAMLGPLDVLIARLKERLRVEEVLRTVIVASPEALAAAPAPAAAPAVAPA
jgi:hypothetical protein